MDTWLIVIFVWIVLCFVVANAWKRVGLSFKQGLLYSFLFSPFLGILFGILFTCGQFQTRQRTEIEHIHEQKVRDTIFCPYCGKSTSTIAKQCQECGHNLTRVFEESEYTCNECNVDVPEDAIYCWKCGKRLA